MQDFISFANDLAALSGSVILRHYRTDLSIEQKGDHSPVTIADREAESAMREMIRRSYPEHEIIGEEYGRENEGAEYTWVLDPIDGTKSFIAGTPLFGTLIALCRGKQPLLGVINLPVLHQCFVGTDAGTAMNGSPVRMREPLSISGSTLLATDYLHMGQYKNQSGFDQLLRRVGLFRTWGDCYGYTLLASGHADIMIDPIMQVWDILALIPVIRGAGGRITDYEGGDPVSGTSTLAAHPRIHDEVIRILNG